MDFQKLRLTGFKSFVEPTDFEIRPGLTGIVGPNGCGKSNLLEALRWVMGATSAKALRAGGMEDVIFSGTGTTERPGRPARSWAEVTLEISNEQRRAPAEYNDCPSLEITRRITKKNEGASSSYRINGKEVRAKDVQLLFADASTGANSPALVRQGQVSDLINAKPENRRKFLEEAAGVTGLYTRRHEAELRLKATATNLERLEDVSGELDAQRGVLARQARQATRYRNIAGHLKKAEALLAFSRWKDADEALIAAEKAMTEALEDLDTTARAAASAHAERERQHNAVEPLRQKEAEAAAALHRLTVEQENFDRDVDRARNEIERLQADKERLERELAREKDLGSDAGAALDALNAEEEQLKQRNGSEAEHLAKAEQAVATASAALKEKETHAEALQRQVAEADAEARALTNAQQQAESALRSALNEATRAREALASFEAEPSKADDIAAKRAQQDELQRLTEEAVAAAKTAEGAYKDAEVQVESAQPARDEAMTAVNRLQAEVDTVRRILAQTEPDGRAILDDIVVDEGFEQALAAALDDGLDASDDSQTDRHWSALGEKPLSTAALPEGAIALSEHISAPSLLNRRLSQIGVVDVADGATLCAQLKPGQRLVSREGDLWRWDGFVARAGAKTTAAMRLEQKRRLSETEAQLTHAFTARDTAETHLGEAKAARNAARDRMAEARKAADNARDAAATLDRQINALESEEQKRDARGNSLRDRIDSLATRLEETRATANAAQQKVADLPDRTALANALDMARRERDQARSDNGRARARQADLRRDADARASRLRQITEQRDGWHKRRQTAEERSNTVTTTYDQTVVALEKAERVPEELETKREGLAEALDAAESRRRVAADELASVQTALTDAEKAGRTAAEAASLAREVKARTEAQRDAAKERLEAQLERAREVHDGPPEDLLAVAEHNPDKGLPDPSDLETKIDRLKREREALGGVNLCADQEMSEIDERIDEIATEKADCEAAIAKLRGAIGSLNRDGRQRLLEAFDRVNATFRDLFTQLFGGGQAELKLVDSEDPLEAGLEILASPPGKKLTSMSLLSGGEQALTATALIFAVFKSNPAPVCVLDEVDAPLDDANTDRFCAMLSRMAEETNTRFIAITHHPLTMSRMDRLYGVTMIERGVSQLVSVDLTEAEKMAA